MAGGSLFPDYQPKKTRSSGVGKKKGKKGEPKPPSKYKYDKTRAYQLSNEETDYLRFLNEGAIDRAPFEFVGSVPSKKNSRIVMKKGPLAGKSLPNTRYTGWHNTMVDQLVFIDQQRVGEMFAEGFRNIAITIYFPTKGVADLTNKAESVMDFIVDQYNNDLSLIFKKYLKDDSWRETGEVMLVPVYRKNVGGFKIEPAELHIWQKLKKVLNMTFEDFRKLLYC